MDYLYSSRRHSHISSTSRRTSCTLYPCRPWECCGLVIFASLFVDGVYGWCPSHSKTNFNWFNGSKTFFYRRNRATSNCRTSNHVHSILCCKWSVFLEYHTRRTWIHKMKAIPSSYHHKISFLTEHGQVDLWGDHKNSWECCRVVHSFLRIMRFFPLSNSNKNYSPRVKMMLSHILSNHSKAIDYLIRVQTCKYYSTHSFQNMK